MSKVTLAIHRASEPGFADSNIEWPIVVDSSVNCDRSLEIGMAAASALDNQLYSEKSIDRQTVIVIDNDTDLLVMMVALATPSMNVYICDTTKGPRVFSISHREKQRRNVELSSSLYAEKPETPKAETENVREFLLKLYGSNKLGSTLDKLRHYKYKQAIEKSSLTSTIKLECLPPTSAAAAQHSLRAYHQVQTWRGKRVDATAWGWQIGGGILAPVETTKGVVPENLLKMVACSCKTQCRKS
ncbi:hypothetical protein CAPTEDRAFT_209473 [Capitella teleta]|uniref:Uncharacterized protein n=1 Tax=Capitella teleta TaxID=283909 RepID=R7U7G8_CAPTE|nr:hypothetical protein CAPTEDRAFT_209473 [Capitella teleta]|eukprot:ELU02310.1 hypothetical protein CAPTEDRAFT_209473 [Capitella teleta]